MWTFAVEVVMELPNHGDHEFELHTNLKRVLRERFSEDPQFQHERAGGERLVVRHQSSKERPENALAEVVVGVDEMLNANGIAPPPDRIFIRASVGRAWSDLGGSSN